MIKDYLLYHKALKEAADTMAFDEIRMRRELFLVLLTAQTIIDDRESDGHPIPHFTASELYHSMVYLQVNVQKSVIYNNILKLEKQGLVEKVVPKKKIGRASKYVLTYLGEYCITHLNSTYSRIKKDNYRFSEERSWI